MSNKLTSLLPTGTNNFLNPLSSALRFQTDTTTPGIIGAFTATAGVAPTSGAFAVNAQGTPNMSVAVTNGSMYVTATATGGTALLYNVFMDVPENVTIANNSSGGTVYDFVYMSLDGTKLNNPASNGLDVATLITSRSTSAYNTTLLATTSGNSNGAIANSVLIAVVTVANGAASIANASITDARFRATDLLPAANSAMVNPYKFSVYRSAALTSASSFTAVAFDTKTFDTGTNVDVVTNKGRFTAPVAGFYYLTAMAGNTVATSTQICVGLYKNGSALQYGTSVDTTLSGGLTSSVVSGVIQLAANDYVEAWFIGGGSSVMAVGSTTCYFHGFLISTL